jgi:hypothetical protein
LNPRRAGLALLLQSEQQEDLQLKKRAGLFFRFTFLVQASDDLVLNCRLYLDP